MEISSYRVPTLVVAVAVVAAIAAAIGAVLRIRAGHATLRTIGQAALLWVIATITAISLEPDSGRAGAGSCSWTLEFDLRFVINQRTLNQALYAPLGFLAVVVARTTRQRIAAVTASLALPVVFELLQSTQFIGRSCDITDMVDNGLGIAIGVVCGLIALQLQRSRSNADRR